MVKKRPYCRSADGVWISVLFPHSLITRVSKFPFCALCDFGGTHFRIITSEESHFGQKRPFRGSSAGGRISVFFPPVAITRGTNFHFCVLRDFGETNFENRHFRRVAFWPKAAIPRDRQRWAAVSLIFAHSNSDVLLNFHYFRFARFWGN